MSVSVSSSGTCDSGTYVPVAFADLSNSQDLETEHVTTEMPSGSAGVQESKSIEQEEKEDKTAQDQYAAFCSNVQGSVQKPSASSVRSSPSVTPSSVTTPVAGDWQKKQDPFTVTTCMYTVALSSCMLMELKKRRESQDWDVVTMEKQNDTFLNTLTKEQYAIVEYIKNVFCLIFLSYSSTKSPQEREAVPVLFYRVVEQLGTERINQWIQELKNINLAQFNDIITVFDAKDSELEAYFSSLNGYLSEIDRWSASEFREIQKRIFSQEESSSSTKESRVVKWVLKWKDWYKNLASFHKESSVNALKKFLETKGL